MKFLPQSALDQHIAILGKTGSGKTFTAKGVVEHVLRQHRQTCVIDPTGAWWGLRLAADGRRKGLDVVLLGGSHADIPLAERSGAAVARLVTEQGASVVIDTSDLGIGERTRWFTEFANTLYRTIRDPLHLVIDEAHNFMPQGKVPDPQAGQMLHAGNQLMAGGRSRGIRGMLITQRPAKLHKDSLTCADTLIAMRMIAPQDRQAVKEWIDGMGDPAKGKAVLDSLAQLQRGEGWVWYPEGGHLDRVKFPAITTYDSSAAPKHGAKAAPKVGSIDLSEVTAALAEAVKEAEANDPKLLRKKIADLERQLKERPAAEVVKEVRVEVPVLANGQLERTETLVKALADTAASVSDNLGELRQSISRATTTAPPAPQPRRDGPSRPSPHLPPRPATLPPRPAPPRPNHPLPGGPLPRGESAILSALIQFPSGLRREQLTVLTGYKRSTRDAYIQRLRERGYILKELHSDLVVASREGIEALPDAEPLPTGEALQAYWLARLPAGEKAILEVLIKHYPDAVDAESLSEATGYKRSSRDAYLQRLAAKELIGERSRGSVKASENLFE